MYLITTDQLRKLRDFADELTRLAAADDQIGAPPAYYLKQIDKAIPEMVTIGTWRSSTRSQGSLTRSRRGFEAHAHHRHLGALRCDPDQRGDLCWRKSFRSC